MYLLLWKFWLLVAVVRIGKYIFFKLFFAFQLSPSLYFPVNNNCNTAVHLQLPWTAVVCIQKAKKNSAADFSCYCNQVILPFLKEFFELLSLNVYKIWMILKWSQVQTKRGVWFKSTVSQTVAQIGDVMSVFITCSLLHIWMYWKLSSDVRSWRVLISGEI